MLDPHVRLQVLLPERLEVAEGAGKRLLLATLKLGVIVQRGVVAVAFQAGGALMSLGRP